MYSVTYQNYDHIRCNAMGVTHPSQGKKMFGYSDKNLGRRLQNKRKSYLKRNCKE